MMLIFFSADRIAGNMDEELLTLQRALNKEQTESLTYLWNKSKFVITKQELIIDLKKKTYFDFGKRLGQGLKTILPPTAEQVVAIGIPEEQLNPTDATVGELQVLKKRIKRIIHAR